MMKEILLRIFVIEIQLPRRPEEVKVRAPSGQCYRRVLDSASMITPGRCTAIASSQGRR